MSLNEAINDYITFTVFILQCNQSAAAHFAAKLT